MTDDSGLRIALLYPELLGTYGDQGNALVLLRRLQWRGIPATLTTVSVGTPAPGQADLYVLGGGEDAAQTAALRELRTSPDFVAAVARGTTVLAVCAGLQVLGTSLELADGSVQPGLGLLDASTTRLTQRAVGDVLADVAPELDVPALLGFENHGGQTVLGPSARPLAHTRVGRGNGTPDAAEGALQGGIIATYLHGPVLALNPHLADLVLSRAAGRSLEDLPDASTTALRAERLARLQPRPARRPSRRFFGTDRAGATTRASTVGS